MAPGRPARPASTAAWSRGEGGLGNSHGTDPAPHGVQAQAHAGCDEPTPGFGISVGTAHAYTAAVVDLLADRTPGLLRALCESAPDYVLLDGTLVGCDRGGDSRADFSHKHRRHGVNVQVMTDLVGQLLWISPTLPGRACDLTEARAH